MCNVYDFYIFQHFAWFFPSYEEQKEREEKIRDVAGGRKQNITQPKLETWLLFQLYSREYDENPSKKW